MSKSRDIRRHHHERMKHRVSKFRWMAPEFYHGSEEQRQKHIAKMVETRHPCSCDMCCNQRRNEWQSGKERLTMQERKVIQEKDYE